MRLQVLDGARTIGGTKLHLWEGGAGFLLDFGLNYRRWGQYFEEFLRPRTARGLFDLWQLGLIPPVGGIYRDDLVPPGFRAPQDARPLEVHAVLLTHAHLDHCGLAGVLRCDLPLVASRLTLAVLKALQDTGPADFYGELAYCRPRGPNASGELEADRSGACAGRPAYAADGPPSRDLLRLWTTLPKARKALQPQPIGPPAPSYGGLRVRTYPVDHSIPGAVAFAVECSDGLVVYTGDLRRHGQGAPLVDAMVSELQRERVSVLVVEGTRVSRERTDHVTEAQVLDRAREVVARSAGRLVVADFGPRQVERLQTFLQVAHDTGRRLVVLPKDGYLLEALAAADPAFAGVLQHPALAFFSRPRLTQEHWLRQFTNRHVRRLVQGEEVRRDPGAYLLAFSFFDLVDLLDVDPQDGVYVYSSSEAYGEDSRVDYWRLWNWLRRLRMEPHGFLWEGTDERGQPVFTGEFHASGHIHPDALLDLIRELKPRYVIPVHTEDPEWFVERLRAEPAKVVVLEEGESFPPP
ncbi:MAG: MBL fold metallo-hydrolase [Armatimonadota bacterium]|nr:MBL fold metallo-hydrolase [Armatimonadota bacterium]MDW8156956.1 MBL fold metallo-hydrolase [Armatimonadota bacterium]